MKIAVVGGGAAGFFAAISVKAHHPDATVTLFEKSDKLLSKVRISGGGRCNVTHACLEPRKLATNYPRGARFLKRSFERFSVRDTVDWFEQRGVELRTEADGRMFPVTDDSRTIIACLMTEADRSQVNVRTQLGVRRITPDGGNFVLGLSTGGTEIVDRVIITSGGHPRPDAYGWVEQLGHTVVPPTPSLFTFNMPEEPIRQLMGVVVPAHIRILGTDLENKGPVLITHWGMSGPAILRLSAWGARILHEKNYEFTVRVNWLEGLSEDGVRQFFNDHTDEMVRKQIGNTNPFRLPKRFWTFLLNKAEIQEDRIWAEVTKKDKNRLIDLLTNDRYSVRGKTTFKEEFVTAGGISLDEVDPLTLQSLKVPGLYFAGEVLDIDGVTGGFNFQAAWTTGYLAGKLG